MSGIGVILNPKSGWNSRDPRAAVRLERALGDRGVVRRAGSVDELYRAAEDFHRWNIDVLGISGGDGTNSVTIGGFIDVYRGSALPQIAFLRGGTMNNTANAVGVRRARPEGLLDQLCRSYVERASRPLQNVERHILCFRAQGARPLNIPGAPPPSESDKFGFVFGTGVVCGFLAEYYASGDPNPRVAAETLLRSVGSAVVGGEMIRRMAEPVVGSVEFPEAAGDPEWPEREYLTIAGGSIDQIGLNFRPFHRFGERPMAFHILGIHTTALELVGQMPRIFCAAPMSPGHAYEALTSRAVVRSPHRPLRYMIDGDLYLCDGSLEVSIGPRVRIVVGT